MEKSLSFLEKMKQEFACEEKDIRTYSPLTLAFVGDCVFDLIIRTVIVERANRSPHDLHKMKSAIVKAKTQAELGEVIQERQAARKAKNFARADEIRNQLLEQGIILEDTREGVKWKRA